GPPGDGTGPADPRLRGIGPGARAQRTAHGGDGHRLGFRHGRWRQRWRGAVPRGGDRRGHPATHPARARRRALLTTSPRTPTPTAPPRPPTQTAPPPPLRTRERRRRVAVG